MILGNNENGPFFTAISVFTLFQPTESRHGPASADRL